MTDSKASIKIQFSIYGEDFKADWWINYFPDDGRIDERVVNWFEECYSKARHKYEAAIYEADKERREKDAEQNERAELARLIAKYGSKP